MDCDAYHLDAIILSDIKMGGAFSRTALFFIYRF